MGVAEQESRKRSRKTKIKSAILTALLLSVVGTLNPAGLTRAIYKELKFDQRKRRSAQSSINRTRNRLIRDGLLVYENGFLRLTPTGQELADKFQTGGFNLVKPKRWDQKWRLLIFDIREERKTLRDKVRRTLISIGFVRLQDSVWVYPYDCEDLITLLKADFKIGKDLLYIIADSIENDRLLREKFGL